MRGRGRLLIILGVILGLVAAGGVLYVMMQGAQPPPTAPPPEVAVPTTQILVAIQNIPRASEILADSVEFRDWPANNVPPDVIADEAELIGKVVKTDIFQGQPIVRAMLTEIVVGSEAAFAIPEGKVAVAFPITRFSSVGYGIEAGDHVDVLLSARFIDREEEKQSARETIDFRVEVMERLAAADVESASFDLPIFEAKARPVTQLVVQNAGVLKVGAWATPTPPPAEEGEEAPPAPLSVPPDMVILVVSQQDALVLKYARENNFILDLALRAAGDEAPVTAEAVTLEYMVRRFKISFPPQLQYYLDTVPPVEEFVPEKPEFPQETSIKTAPLEFVSPEGGATP
ncbi:MAG: Flp pilus assembly protein CpaB [Anaerolineales bacterium]|nr:MAG: Flp pilus assembly protein CpaB [Anaerolineales bacterium]